MPDIASIGQGGVGPLARPEGLVRTNGTSTRGVDEGLADGRARDRVELSEQARLLDQLRKLPSVREDLVEQVRTSIADDAYLTDDKLDIAIERLLEDISG